jgi:cysteine desulfurase
LINAEPNEIIFTSGGTEANNMIMNAFAGQQVIVSSIEHPSVLEPARVRTKTNLVAVDKLGQVCSDKLGQLLQKSPALVSIMLANNEIGVMADVVKLTTLAHKHGALMHTDATQAIGKIPVDVKTLDVDYLTMSAHKIGGPKGIGALYVRGSRPIKPFNLGGHQESSLRAGTYNTLGIVGFGQAAKLALTTPAKYQAKTKPLVDKLRQGLIDTVPLITINGDQKNCLPNTLNVSFAGAEGESILLALEAVGIAVSTGSACASGDIAPSHVLMAIKADPELAHGSIRFSLGLETSAHDIDYVLQQLPPIIQRLRQMSTIKLQGGV